jgi:DNA-directed RNA polymerase subunit beta
MLTTATRVLRGNGELVLNDIKSYARVRDVYSLPNLIENQVQSYQWLQEEGLAELFQEISPIVSFNGNLEMYFLDYWFDEPKYGEDECRARDMTFAGPLYVRVRLKNNEAGGEITEQSIYMGDFPLMTPQGTFVINGAERAVVSQLIRSPGAYFTVSEDRVSGRRLCMAKLIPNRGAWLELETNRRDLLSVKVDRKRKIPVTVLLRALGVINGAVEGAELIREGTDEELLNLFAAVDNDPDHPYLASTIEKDPTKGSRAALEEFYKRMRPGDPPTFENARGYLDALLFNPRRYDLGKVGRYKLNRRLRLDIPQQIRTLTKLDLVRIVERMMLVNNGVEDPDDIDHLGNRRVKTVGELIQNQLRIGLLRMERMVRDRMSTRVPQQLTPVALINVRPVVAVLREFFGGSQLSQFMDQTNPLAELTHKRRLSALGPGGLRRERAGFDVRDVHHSHYGRICPIETPEGPNIGLIGSLASYGRINEYGFIETPYRRVLRAVPNNHETTLGKTLRERVTVPDTGEVVAEAGTEIDQDIALRLEALPLEEIPIVPMVTDETVYLTADQEDQHVIAQAGIRMDDKGQVLDKRVSVRYDQRFMIEAADQVEYMDVSPKQIVGVSAALIPFLEHDDANRALMGSNMQRQAVPLLQPEVPLVGTGVERQAALDSGQLVVAQGDSEAVSVTGERIVLRTPEGEKIHTLRRYDRSNQSTCLDQRPIVSKGDRIRSGQALADSSSTDRGELALGQNVLVAFLSWEGGNYEDAILISKELVRQDKFTSIHIEKHEVDSRDTKLGPEEITRDIPNIGEEALRNLDEEGVIHIGAEVGPSDILVGKITPKGETELSPEEKLLRAIFGEKAWEVKDSSLRLPHGERGKVVDIKVFSRDEHRDMSAGVDKMVRVSVAQKRKVTEGDKMAGRHGNKGVISRVVPTEDMPFLEDGTPVDIILNPLGVPARMNVGQILETHLGWAADRLGFRAISPVFDGASEEEIAAELARAWMIDRAWRDLNERMWPWFSEVGIDTDTLESDQEARHVYLREHLSLSEESEDIDEILSDQNLARWAWLRQWLAEQGYVLSELCIGDNTGATEAEQKQADKQAIVACLRCWLRDLEHDTSAVSDDDLEAEARRVSAELKMPLPTSGKMILYDGKTGMPFDRPVTVGVIYMMKLAHLVEDKVHARSTGPYSLVTQQPLGGKAQQGGQRFGEMEVWALEAYGAAHTLQEMLTVKSDDVTSRVRAYEAIVKGERIQEPSIPESFRVLVKELQGLGLAVEVLNESGDVLQFGREEGEERLPRLGLGLGLPGFARRPRVG